MNGQAVDGNSNEQPTLPDRRDRGSLQRSSEEFESNVAPFELKKFTKDSPFFPRRREYEFRTEEKNKQMIKSYASLNFKLQSLRKGLARYPISKVKKL